LALQLVDVRGGRRKIPASSSLPACQCRRGSAPKIAPHLVGEKKAGWKAGLDF